MSQYINDHLQSRKMSVNNTEEKLK